MSKTLDSKTIGEKLYNTLPPLYHSTDSMVDYALKRYLQALADGGFKYVIDEANGILELNDPDKTPFEVLSILFEQYGLPLFNGLPESYLRKLLPILGDLYARKGATTVIEYLTSIISDVKSEVVVSPDFINDFHIDLRMEMDYDQTGARDIPDREQLLRIINEFLPFFVNVTIIFVYLFYEVAKLKAEEYHEMTVTDTKNEGGRLVRQKGEGFFPVLNNYDLGLNKNIYLSESYYYDVDVDWVRNHIIYHVVEYGKVKKEADEFLSTEITLVPHDDLARLRETYSEFVEKVHEIASDGGSIASIGLIDDDSALMGYATFNKAILNKDPLTGSYILSDYFHDTIVQEVEEEGSMYSDDTELLQKHLNTGRYILNTSFITNGRVKPDDFDDYISEIKSDEGSVKCLEADTTKSSQVLSEEGSLYGNAVPSDDTENQSSVLGVAILGKAVFNSDGDLIVDPHTDSVTEVVVDSGKFKEPVDTTTNRSYNVLNSSFHTNGLYCYDKITIGGVTQIVVL